METAQTDPKIQSAIITHLTQCLNSQPPTPLPETSPHIQAVIDKQNDIGWENFFEVAWLKNGSTPKYSITNGANPKNLVAGGPLL